MSAVVRERKTCFPPVLDQYLPQVVESALVGQQDDHHTSPDDTEEPFHHTNDGYEAEKEDEEDDEDEETEEPAGIQRIINPDRSANTTTKSVTLASDLRRPGHRRHHHHHQQQQQQGKGKKPETSSYPGRRAAAGIPQYMHPPRRQPTVMSMASTGSVGRRSELRRREAEAERLEHVADVWEQARAEVLSERHAQLQEKVQLQHRLVRVQDLQALQIRQYQREQETLKRQEEKEQKQKKEAALQDICKQSLDSDKKKAVSERQRNGTGTGTVTGDGSRTGRRSGSGGVLSRSSGLSSPTSSDGGGGEPRVFANDGDSDSGESGRGGGGGGGGRALRPSHRHPGYRPSLGLPEQPTPMRELEDEEKEEEEEVMAGRWSAGGSGSGSQGSPMSGEKGGDNIPSHHAQLYQLYGKQADYFLHPKQPTPTTTTQQQPSQRRQTHPKLRNQKGHIGAGELWDTLRKDSKDKLIRNDRRFPMELKSAFSAFVRERLTKHVRPVERSFCATEDVPDIKRLMDQSKLRNTRMYRHKTELMYRSSVTNKDRTSILLNDNPMPDITLAAQSDSINRYLPSWVDDLSVMSDPEYMKWISASKEGEEEEEEEEKENVRRSAHSRQLSETTNELHNIWHTITASKKKPKTPRYQFLTEKEARCAGSFSQKFQEEREQREKPQPHHLAKAQSAMDFSHPASAFSVPATRERGRSVQTAMQLDRFTSDWEPLSMGALVEYKKRLEVEGEGDFEHGRVKMWPAVTSSVA